MYCTDLSNITGIVSVSAYYRYSIGIYRYAEKRERAVFAYISLDLFALSPRSALELYSTLFPPLSAQLRNRSFLSR